MNLSTRIHEPQNSWHTMAMAMAYYLHRIAYMRTILVVLIWTVMSVLPKTAWSGFDNSHFSQITQDRSKAKKLRILLVGDSGYITQERATVSSAIQSQHSISPFDLILGTGDHFYLPEGIKEGANLYPLTDEVIQRQIYQAFTFTPKIELFLQSGNHIWSDFTSGSAQRLMAETWRSDILRFPNLFYAIPKLPSWLKILTINTEVYYPDSQVSLWGKDKEKWLADQNDFLNEELSSFKGLKIVVGHSPAIYSGKRSFRNEGENQHLEKLVNLFEAQKIHFYVSGHEHQQSHSITSTFEQITQGAMSYVNTKHTLRGNGSGDSRKIYKFQKLAFGFGVLEVEISGQSLLQYFEVEMPSGKTSLIYEKKYNSLIDIGRSNLQPLSKGCIDYLQVSGRDSGDSVK